MPQKRNITYALAFLAPRNPKHGDQSGHYGYRQMWKLASNRASAALEE